MNSPKFGVIPPSGYTGKAINDPRNGVVVTPRVCSNCGRFYNRAYRSSQGKMWCEHCINPNLLAPNNLKK